MTGLSALRLPVQETRRMTIKFDGEPIVDARGEPGWIELLPMSSPEGKQRVKDVINRQKASKGKLFTEADSLEKENIEMLVTLTKGWRIVGFDGAVHDIECTAEAVRSTYEDPGFDWLTQQVQTFVADPGNWKPGAITTP